MAIAAAANVNQPSSPTARPKLWPKRKPTTPKTAAHVIPPSTLNSKNSHGGETIDASEYRGKHAEHGDEAS
ncbi:hypothetical protein ACVWXO_005627 [Bradyrhizobium sp. LM2.7]